MGRPVITAEEFGARNRRTQELMKEQGVDILLCYGNEAEPQFVRYLCNYWPSFETAGVLLAQEGEPMLLIGPESMTYASDRSVLQNIRRLSAFRESSNPEYPGHTLDTFEALIEELLGGNRVSRAAIAGYNLISKITYDEFHHAVSAMGAKEIERGDDILIRQRMIKSEAEIECMREAGRITRETFSFVIENMRPGMTESQVRGLANAKLFEMGGECEAYPIWVLAGKGGNQAISRARHKVIQPNELVHLQIGARYEGYASTIGRPVIVGKPEQWMLDAINAGYEGYETIRSQLFSGNNAGNVAKAFYETMGKNGYADWLLYGPCHGTGLMEGEPPWIESNSDYLMQTNQTYCICLFMGNDDGYGFRLEDSMRVAPGEPESMTDFKREIIII